MGLPWRPAGLINAAMLLRFGKRINLFPVYEAAIVQQISDGGAAGELRGGETDGGRRDRRQQPADWPLERGDECAERDASAKVQVWKVQPQRRGLRMENVGGCL